MTPIALVVANSTKWVLEGGLHLLGTGFFLVCNQGFSRQRFQNQAQSIPGYSPLICLQAQVLYGYRPNLDFLLSQIKGV